jgi:glycosyltransferase involved in cell wall biosynthesis
VVFGYRHFHNEASVARIQVRVAAFLRDEGHDVHVVAFRETFDASLAGGMTVHLVDGYREGLFPPRDLWTYAAKAQRVINSLDADVVYSRVPSVLSADIAYLPGVYLGEHARSGSDLFHWLVRLRHMSQLSRVASEALLVRSRRVRKFHADSPFVLEDLVRFWGVDPADITLTTPGVDLEVFDHGDRAAARASLDLPSDRVMILFCGHDFYRKGLDRALRMLRAVPDATLLVLGGGCSAGYRQLLSGGLAERVIFAGTTTSPQAYFRASDIVVLPTRWDMWGAPVIEAMAAGVPVVTSAAAGAASAVTHGREGFVLADPWDDDLFAASVQMLVARPQLRLEFGRRGRVAARDHSWDKHGATVAADVVEVAAAPRLVQSRIATRRRVSYVSGAPLLNLTA